MTGDPTSMLRWPRDFMSEAADRRVVRMRGYTIGDERFVELTLDDDSVVVCGGIEAGET